MKKIWIVGVVAVVAVLALGVTGYAYAQSRNPNPAYPGYGPGMMGGRRGGGYGPAMMGGQNWNGQSAGYGPGMMGGLGYGPMHTYMVDALAERLDLTAEELQTRFDAGETPWQIAQSQGLSDEEIRNLFLEVHDEALSQAVANGLITQAQAEWMDQHMEQAWANGAPRFGACHGGGNFTGQQP